MSAIAELFLMLHWCLCARALAWPCSPVLIVGAVLAECLTSWGAIGHIALQQECTYDLSCLIG